MSETNFEAFLEFEILMLCGAFLQRPEGKATKKRRKDFGGFRDPFSGGKLIGKLNFDVHPFIHFQLPPMPRHSNLRNGPLADWRCRLNLPLPRGRPRIGRADGPPNRAGHRPLDEGRRWLLNSGKRIKNGNGGADHCHCHLMHLLIRGHVDCPRLRRCLSILMATGHHIGVESMLAGICP